MSIEIYTDGSCKDGRGSWAFVVVVQGQLTHSASGYKASHSSLEMEIFAVLNALEFSQSSNQIVIFSDCKILIDAMMDGGRSLQSSHSRYSLLHEMSINRKVHWRWLKGHAGNHYNELCDQLCRNLINSASSFSHSNS